MPDLRFFLDLLTTELELLLLLLELSLSTSSGMAIANLIGSKVGIVVVAAVGFGVASVVKGDTSAAVGFEVASVGMGVTRPEVATCCAQ